MNQKNKRAKIIYIVATLVVILLVFFLIFVPNVQKSFDIDAETAKLERRALDLNLLDVQVAKLDKENKAQTTFKNQYIAKFSPKLTQEKAIEHIYNLCRDSGIKIVSISPDNKVVFLKNGTIQVGTETKESVKSSDDELDVKTSIFEMTGKMMTYEVGFHGTFKQLMKGFDWVSKNKENMSLGNINITYDATTGELSGTFAINFYALLGNGATYTAPKLANYTYGVDQIFGTFKK